MMMRYQRAIAAFIAGILVLGGLLLLITAIIKYTTIGIALTLLGIIFLYYAMRR